MKKVVLSIINVFAVLTMVGALGRIAFYVVHHSMIESGGEASFLPMLWHGLRLDMAVASYFSFIPVLLNIVKLWCSSRIIRVVELCYYAVIAFALALAITANIALYGYWGFPLDATPLFYLITSPADAAASATPLMLIGAIVSVALTASVVYMLLARSGKVRWMMPVRQSLYATILLLVCMGLLVIPARGGFTVAVNNVGSVYFSDNIRLNHAAVNPAFSFIESVSHDDDFAMKYRFLDDEEADERFRELTYTKMRSAPTDSLLPLSHEFLGAVERKNGDVKVVMVILESFSKYIMTEGGRVKGVTPVIDSLADEGIYFTNFYANSFRTDRGLMAILSGFPAQPTMSLMKYPRKTNDIYAISRSLKNAGYATQYIYGGDANFTNMRSYLMATGFNEVISEEDYDKSLRTGKWGVNDSVLFARALQEMKTDKKGRRAFRVIQTSSSHEPFEVPHHAMKNNRLNAFHYTDQCLGNFLKELRQREDWKRTLVVVVPDHLGCYPEDIDNFKMYRYQIPLIFTGGAVEQTKRIETIGSQQDIAATLLAILRIDHSEFTYSKDMLDSLSPHFAFFAVPDAMGMVTEENTVIFDNTSGKTVLDTGRKGRNLLNMQAYLQKIYDDIAKR